MNASFGKLLRKETKTWVFARNCGAPDLLGLAFSEDNHSMICAPNLPMKTLLERFSTFGAVASRK